MRKIVEMIFDRKQAVDSLLAVLLHKVVLNCVSSAVGLSVGN